MLTRLAAAASAVAIIAIVAACDDAPPSPVAGRPAAGRPEPTVAARWAADDGSVVAINLVVPDDTDPREARGFAERQRAAHPTARVIVRVFAATAGPERFVIGHVPVGDDPLPADSHPTSLLALYDFPA